MFFNCPKVPYILDKRKKKFLEKTSCQTIYCVKSLLCIVFF